MLDQNVFPRKQLVESGRGIVSRGCYVQCVIGAANIIGAARGRVCVCVGGRGGVCLLVSVCVCACVCACVCVSVTPPMTKTTPQCFPESISPVSTRRYYSLATVNQTQGKRELCTT